MRETWNRTERGRERDRERERILARQPCGEFQVDAPLCSLEFEREFDAPRHPLTSFHPTHYPGLSPRAPTRICDSGSHTTRPNFRPSKSRSGLSRSYRSRTAPHLTIVFFIILLVTYLQFSNFPNLKRFLSLYPLPLPFTLECNLINATRNRDRDYLVTYYIRIFRD